MKKAILLSALLLGCVAGLAEDKLVITPTLSITPDCKKSLKEDAEKTVRQAVNLSLNLLKKVPPKEGDHVFKWEKKEQLKGKRISIVLINSDDEILTKLAGDMKIPDNTDAMTATIVDDDGKVVVYVFIIVDKIFLDGGKEREDFFGRLTSAMAMAFYGEIPAKLKMSAKDLEKEQTFDQRKKSQIAAYQATIDFFDRLKAHEFYKTFTDAEKAIFEKRIELNKEGLEAWKNREEKK